MFVRALFCYCYFAFLLEQSAHVNFLICSGQTVFTLSVMMIDQLRFDASQKQHLSNKWLRWHHAIAKRAKLIAWLTVWAHTLWLFNFLFGICFSLPAQDRIIYRLPSNNGLTQQTMFFLCKKVRTINSLWCQYTDGGLVYCSWFGIDVLFNHIKCFDMFSHRFSF